VKIDSGFPDVSTDVSEMGQASRARKLCWSLGFSRRGRALHREVKRSAAGVVPALMRTAR